MSEQLIQDIQTLGWTPERIEEFVGSATPEQLDNVRFNNLSVLLVIPRMSMRMRTPEQQESLIGFLTIALERGANPNITGEEGYTPLINVVRDASNKPRLALRMIQVLASHGADINARDRHSRTALNIAASEGGRYITNTEDRATVLYVLLQTLVRVGADINNQTDTGETPLMTVIERDEQDSTHIIEFFVMEPQTNLALVDNRGQTALMKASKAGNGAFVEAILRGRDVGVNLQDADGDTALMMACRLEGYDAEDRDQIIGALLNAGADKALANNEGKTAHDILKEISPYSRMVDQLEPESPASPIIAPSGPVRSSRGARATGTRPAGLGSPPVRRLLSPDDQPPTPPLSPPSHTAAEGDGDGWVTARPLPPPSRPAPPRIAVAPGQTGQRRRLPWEVRPYGRQAATPASPARRRSRDEVEDEDDDVAPWEAKRRDIKVNVNQTVSWFDPIMQEEETVNIKDYLAESPGNIVIAYGPNLSQFFFTDRDTFAKQKDDATFFACKDVDTLRASNIISSKPLYDLKFIGLIDGGFCDVSVMTAKPSHQVFAIDSTGKTYPSFVSDHVLNRGALFVSGLHCQAGQERRVTMLVAATPVETALGGRRRSKRNRVTRRKKRAGKANAKTKAKAIRRKHRKGHTRRAAGGKPHRRTRKGGVAYYDPRS